MSKELLEIRLRTVDDRIKLSASTDDDPEIVLDYFPPIGTDKGYTPLELILISFTGCVSTVLITYLRSIQKKQVLSLQAKSEGDVRQEHPKALTHIRVALTFHSPDLEEQDVRTALKAAETRLCPVWAMLKGNVETDVVFAIER
jgi:putative redox protein